MNFQSQQPINQFYPGQQPYMPNPYMQRMENLQQFQQAIQPQTQMQGANNFTPLGKIVDSVDIVKATDIPMDGNMYYFPKADGSEIFGKQWLANGQTRILTFKASLDEEGNNLSSEAEKFKIDAFNELTDTFQEMFDTVIERIDKLEKSLKPNSRTKKEVNADE
jgi:hypothetical protein